jgi:hypothetical protein
MPVPIIARCLESGGGIRHGFFTRTGGHSKGIYASLNCGLGSRDERADVIRNREAVATLLGTTSERLLTANQIHSSDALIVTAPWTYDSRPKVDGLVTATPGLAIAVLTADCAPVLFADREAGVIGAAHAGWRGAVKGVIEACVEAMLRLGARRDRIVAAVGPCISQANYEVGPEFESDVTGKDPASRPFFVPGSTGRAHFDLPGYVASRLQRVGVDRVERQTSCTFADATRFFSYRRSGKSGEPDYGRQVSAIVLT